MSATIIIGGDYCPSLRVDNKIKNNQGNSIWRHMQSILKNSDFNIVNLEAPVVTELAIPISKAGPTLKSSDDSIKLLKSNGIHMVTLANNHMFDYGVTGLHDTIKSLNSNGIEYIGIGENIKDSMKSVIKEINGIKIGLINACETEFSIAKNDSPGCRPLDIISIHGDIVNLKKKTDYVIVIIHGGHEHYQLPSPRMKKIYNFFIDCGANIVVNHHQHCFSGFEEKNGNYIFYGLGNLCFDHLKKRSGIWTEGFLLKLKFEKKGITPQIIPYIQCGEEASIIPLKGNDVDKFDSRIRELNKIIAQENLLEENFNEWVSKNKMRYISNIAPFSSKIFRGLVRFKILPSFLSKTRKNILFDMFFCESHSDVIKKIIDESKINN